MPSCLVIQHVEVEGPYALGNAIAEAGVEVVVVRTDLGEQPPARIGDFNGLIVMGGPMSATSDTGFTSRTREIALLAEAVALELPALGICLGAQLLAGAAGATVSAGVAGAEIGWAPVRLEDAVTDDPLFSGFPSRITVLHWHGDTYTLPPGALRLASNTTYVEQAFRIGPRAWGLQFHLEVDSVAVDRFVRAFEGEVRSAGTTPEEIRAASPSALKALAPFRDLFASRFATLVATGGGPRTRLDQLAGQD